MIPQLIDPMASPMEKCQLGTQWILDERLLERLYCMAARLPFPIEIFSGYRSPETQGALIAEPDSVAAPVDLSNHTTCPSRAADVRPLVGVTNVIKATLGEAALVCGLRWGGGAPVDPESGIPIKQEWMHVDLGPRPR